MSDSAGSPGISSEDERRRIVNRLRRLSGQVRGVASMLGSEKECEAVLTQVMAIKSALGQVGMHVIGHAMKTCLIDDSLSEKDDLVAAAFGVYLHYRDLGAAAGCSPSADMGSTEKIMSGLETLEAQLKAVELVIAGNGDCEDALKQLSAATATLNDVSLAILGRAMHRCLISKTDASRDEVIDQAIEIFLRYSSCAR